MSKDVKYDLFKKEKEDGEDTGYFAILIQNLKTYESHELCRNAVRLPCKIYGEYDEKEPYYKVYWEN